MNAEENSKPAKDNPKTRTEVKALQLSNSTNTLPGGSSRPDANLIDLNSPAYDKPKKNEDFLEFLETQKEPLKHSQPSHRLAENRGTLLSIHKQTPLDVGPNQVNSTSLLLQVAHARSRLHGKSASQRETALLIVPSGACH